MKRILILTYDFPPYVSAGDCVPYGWYTYFHLYDIYPVVVTRNWVDKRDRDTDCVDAGETSSTLVEETAQGTIIRTPCFSNLTNRLLPKYGNKRWVLLQKILTRWLEITEWFWIADRNKKIYNAAREYLKTHRVDLIIATAYPLIMFRFASRLGKEFNIPWIADYRWPVSDNVNDKHNSAFGKFNSKIERKTLKTAELITTVNVFSKSIIKKNIKDKTITIVPNGYDEDVLRQIVIENKQELSETIDKLYKEFDQNKRIEYNSTGKEKFSQRHHALSLANIIKAEISKQYIRECTACKGAELKKLENYKTHHLVKCGNCGLIFSNLIPKESEIQEVYSSYGRNDYLSEITIKRYHELLNKFEKYRKTNRILDVGCGIGYFLEVAKKRNWEVYGTEFTENAVAICKNKGINMSIGALEPNMFEDSFFDVITSIEVIEHLYNTKETFEMFNKYLRKGGALYVTTPNFNSISRIKQGASWRNIAYPEHLTYFTKESLNYVLLRSGFKKITLITSGLSISDWQKTADGLHINPVSENSSDEKLRQEFEKSKLKKMIKNILNWLLNLTSKGDSLKAFYLKK